MKSVMIILSVMILTLPSMVNACDPDCENNLPTRIGIPTIIGTTIIIPAIGRAFSDRENPPFNISARFTFLASSAGVLIADQLYFGDGSSVEDFGEILVEFIVMPIVFGTVATYLTYRFTSRQTDKTSNALLQYVPQVSVSSLARGGSVRLDWSF